MSRKLSAGVFGPVIVTLLILFVPIGPFPIGPAAFAATQQPEIVASSSPALHLMNDSEFALFLKRLDTAALDWEAQLKSVDVQSLELSSEDGAELRRTDSLCLQSLSNTRDQVERLLEKQTLKGDLLLLVDLNDLARSLDSLDRDLANATAAQPHGNVQKSLSYVKTVLSIDTALAVHTGEFQTHVFAFAKVIDASLEESQEATGPSATE